MKNFKKVLSLALAVMMVIGGLAIAPMDAKADDPAYTKVTSVSEITAGGNFVLVAQKTSDGTYYAPGEFESGKGFTPVAVTLESEMLTTTGISTIAIAAGETEGQVTLTYGGKQIYGSTTENKLYDDASNSAADVAEFLVTDADGDGEFEFELPDTDPVRYIAFNSSGNTIRQYKDKSSDTSYDQEFLVFKAASAVDVETQKDIVEAAYALEVGASLEGDKTLTGVVTEVNTAYNSQYGNVTVTIQVENLCDSPIMCYRLTGTGADAIGVGDEITVTGEIMNYDGTIEFVSGCNLDSYTTQEELIEAGTTLTGKHALVGEIVAVDTPWNDSYNNITVTMQVGETQLQAYRATLADTNDTEAVAAIKELAIGDTVVVYGTFSEYQGNLQFASGSFISILEKGELPDTLPQTATQEEIIEAAYNAMDTGVPMIGEYTLTGVIKKIDTPYAASYNNITVTIGFEGMEETIQCYRLTVASDASDELKAAIAELAVGDTITVRGSFGSYNGTVQYNAGSLLLDVEKGELPDTLPQTATPEEIVNAAYEAMENNGAVIGTYTLTGTITSIDTEYAENYNNITVTMVVDGMTDKPIQCFRLTVAADASEELQAALAALAVDDVITVKGTFGYYNGKVQYNQGSILTAVNTGGVQAPPTGEINMVGAYVVLGVSALALAVVEFKKRR